MIPSFRNTANYLRLINTNIIQNGVKEFKSKFINNNAREHLKILPRFTTVQFSPRSIGVEILDQNVNKRKEDPLKYIPIINPRSILPLVEDVWKKNEIGLPTPVHEEKQAVRLIVIRRKKMKKHKRKKLLKRMKFKWELRTIRRKIMKEKAFRAELDGMIKMANDFSAEDYVKDKLQRANREMLPPRFRNSRLPDFIIRQIMGIDKKINYKHTDVFKA